jgi:ABC-type sugar transport system substrate-binding protein
MDTLPSVATLTLGRYAACGAIDEVLCKNANMPDTLRMFSLSHENDYQQRLKEVGLREAKRWGFELVVEFAQNDPLRQAEQVREALKNAKATNLRGIIVSVVRDDVVPDLARRAAEARIDFAMLSDVVRVDDVRAEFPESVIFVVTPDQMEIGRIQGRQVQALVGQAGTVLCVTGPMGTVMAQQRLAGLKEQLGDKFKIIELNADWTSERARMVVEKWAKELPADAQLPDMVVAHNDEIGLGVRQALRDFASRRDLESTTPSITGCDGSQTFGQRLVREGRLKSTVIQPPGSGAAIELMAKHLTKNERPPLRIVQPVTSFPALSSLKR